MWPSLLILYSAYLVIMFGARLASAGFTVKHLSWKTLGNNRQRILPTITLPSSSNRLSYRPFLQQKSMQSADTSSAAAAAAAATPEFLQRILHESLRRIHLDPEEIQQANEKNVRDPTEGYDATFGRPAIRTYRAFVFSNKVVVDERENSRLLAAADRCAQQIDFLRKRHRSQSADWVRNHDSQEKLDNGESGNSDENPTKRFPIILVLDNVRSAFNVGSLFRTADACGCQELITTGITAHPGGSGAEKLSKSALGSERLVPSRHFSTTQDALAMLKCDYPDWTLIGMETTESSVEYTQLAYDPSGIVVICGNEVTGVEPDVLTELDSIVEIPMFGAKNSLNVAACAPVVLYEIIRQWGLSSSGRKND